MLHIEASPIAEYIIIIIKLMLVLNWKYGNLRWVDQKGDTKFQSFGMSTEAEVKVEKAHGSYQDWDVGWRCVC